MTELKDGLSSESFITIKENFLLEGERVEDLYSRLAITAAQLNPLLDAEELYYVLSQQWLGPATPVAANLGREENFPVSCFGLQPGNSVHDIFEASKLQALLSKNGGGVSVDITNLVGPTEPYRWAKIYDFTADIVSQTGVRRGATAIYLDAYSEGIHKFLATRDLHDGGDYRGKLDCNIALILSDKFMGNLLKGHQYESEIFQKALVLRMQTGSPYFFFIDNAQHADPEVYTRFGLSTKNSNICSEIQLHTDPNTGFACVLSSLNLAKYNEWQNWESREGLSLPQLGIYFLDAVTEEFLLKAKASYYADALLPVIRGAEKGRPLGLGVMGFHTYLQQNMIPFESTQARVVNREIFSWIHREVWSASKKLAQQFGEPDWLKGTGLRNTHCTAVAPTVTNSVIVGGVSPGVEPIDSNCYSYVGAKGTFLRKNPTLTDFLTTDQEEWANIASNKGSVQHLDFLREDVKQVFKTARELDQNALITLAAERQPYIDQGQSINLFFNHDADPGYIAKIHIDAWLKGLKTLYYLRSTAPTQEKTDSCPLIKTEDTDCGCDG